MKANLLYLIAIITFFTGRIYAQAGLEDIIVEIYYISDANDQTVNDVGGTLPNESVTYRVFVDMLPDYKLQAIYGVPGHEMRIETTSLFFNNEDRGATTPTYTKAQARNNTVMLDSWLSVGAACTGQFGVLKSEDNGIDNNQNNDEVLQNNNVAAGIPLTQQDGLIAGMPQNVTSLGLDNIITVFDNQNDGTNGPVFSTEDGSWAALSGASGPIAETNRVLIGQFTTDGVFSFKLNIQIGTPDGGVEQYVAENPVGDEILFEGLNYVSDVVTSSKYLSAEEDMMVVSPNPVVELLNIQLSQKSISAGRINLYDTKGSVVKTFTVSAFLHHDTIQINTIDLLPGAYILELIQDGRRSTERIIKF